MTPVPNKEVVPWWDAKAQEISQCVLNSGSLVRSEEHEGDNCCETGWIGHAKEGFAELVAQAAKRERERNLVAIRRIQVQLPVAGNSRRLIHMLIEDLSQDL